MKDIDEIYPMPAFPTIEASDLPAVSAWYQAMGFHHIFTMPDAAGAPLLVHLQWAKYADLLLMKATGNGSHPRGQGIGLNFALFARVGETVDQVAERARTLGAVIVSGPADRPWNVRDVTVADPDGYRLVFSEAIDISTSLETVVTQTAEAAQVRS